MDIEILDGDILDCVRQNLGLEPNDGSKDDQIKAMDQMELFERYLTWNGIIGYSDQIWEAVEYIRHAYAD